MTLLLHHNSRCAEDRTPFGAVPSDRDVRLRVTAQGETPDAVWLGYAYGLETFSTGCIRMEADSDGSYTAILRTPGAPCLLFYWFEAVSGNRTRFLVRDGAKSDGTGVLWDIRPDFSSEARFTQSVFQITVYDDAARFSDWMAGAVVYQIFPDRYARSPDYDPNAAEAAFGKPERIFHADWNEEVDYTGKPDTGYLACDFFGGSLNGITDRLDAIKDLGVDVLYLNPVFKARSNHRYDTGDYRTVDPLLGTNDDLVRLCAEAKARGIRVLLDGVFSHTGADSRYFNKLGRYPDPGAWQNATDGTYSPYASWYTFHRQGNHLSYESWWGFPDLPAVRELDLSFRKYINGKDGVVRHWIRQGVSGWRLDVSDELPDEFLREIRAAARKEDPDSCILGEVWEDASNKVSYGQFRDFIFGRTHDSFMGYPFRDLVLDWLCGGRTAKQLANGLNGLRENYPLPVLYRNMNLISSHDVPRALTVLSGVPDPERRDRQAAVRLKDGERKRATALLKLAVLFQVLFPGAVSVYYGDETGMEGFRDPFNRRTYPWGSEDKDLIAWFSQTLHLRDMPVLRTGYVDVTVEENGLVRIRRWLADGMDVFGAEANGPNDITTWFNPSDVRMTAGGVVLPSCSFRVVIDGEEWQRAEQQP